MTHRPCVIDEKLLVADAMDRMLANNIRHLIVVSNDQAVGVVEAGDLSRAAELSSRSTRELTLAEVKQPFFQCSSDMLVVEVVRVMESHHYSCSVVIEQGRVVGIFTLEDALRALRHMLRGRPVEPQVVPTHLPRIPLEREKTPPRVRATGMLANRRVVPSARDGLVFGTVGL